MLESEAAAIRMDLKRALIKIGEMESAMGKLQDDIANLKNENNNLKNENNNLKNENARLKKDNARLEARLAFYGSANMSSSTTSLYNAARKKFRKGRGEKISGNPGEKIKGDSKEGNGGQDQDGGSGGGGQEKAARIGPPAGHAGISHGNQPEFTVRHALKAVACPGCHVELVPARPTCKLICDLDEYYATRTFTAVIEAAACPECGKKNQGTQPVPGRHVVRAGHACSNQRPVCKGSHRRVHRAPRARVVRRQDVHKRGDKRPHRSLGIPGADRMIARIKAAILCQMWGADGRDCLQAR